MRLEVGVVDEVSSEGERGLEQLQCLGFKSRVLRIESWHWVFPWFNGSFQPELNVYESCLDFHEAKSLANGYLTNH